LSFFIPAEMHGAQPGMPEYFVQDGGSLDAISDHVNVVTMTDFLSNSPTYVVTEIQVNPYPELTTGADQPTAPGMVMTNGTQFTQADWRNGKLATAHTVFEPDDNFATSRVRWYQFDTTGPTPTLIQQGSIHPGPGVSTYQGSIAQDAAGNLGMTYMQSSAHDYVSMYVATKLVGTPLGVMGNGVPAAPGLGLMPVSDYTGDYSTVEVDPTDGMTFWAANEYVGADGGTDIWRTHIASFQATADPGANFFAVRAKRGDSLDISVTVPGAGPGQFDNAFIPAVYLYDPSGALVAFDEAQDGGDPTVTIHFQVPAHGQGEYTIQVAPSLLTSQPTQGEYALVVTEGEAGESATAAAAGMTTTGPIHAAAAGRATAVGGGDGRHPAIANSVAVGRWHDRTIPGAPVQNRSIPGVAFTPVESAPSSSALPKKASARAAGPDMPGAAAFEVGRHRKLGFTRSAIGLLQGLRRSSVPMRLIDR
jgi:hypothetical protein